METTAVFQAEPRTSIRRIVWRMLWKVLEWIMMLVGILTTAAFTLAIGWGLVSWRVEIESLPVLDGWGRNGRSADTAFVIEAPTETEAYWAEMDWLALHRPFDAVTGDRIVGEGDVIYQVLELESWRGRTYEIWFDITKPYGHE